ncbi:GNAT family N-acetyltransferase [Desulfopila sp. IMCC35008]|uniref:GNAT family N-acetyltransferase n=1 Tax=Desulfopila sp. IMCC35008 TaxID=2653858 RepID=UPI0013CFC7F9|nr:GNAT family N-acetyltransferase [Desulfopila sp. IMCC35008]
MKIIPAVANDAHILTAISFRSKKYWQYPDEYLAIWADELTVTEQYILDNYVFVATKNDVLVGYYSVVEVKEDFEMAAVRIEKGIWLEHMFVDPEYIGQKVGTAMVGHLKTIWQQRGVRTIRVLADPNARGFYEKNGFGYIRECPSTIVGRTTPLLELAFG